MKILLVGDSIHMDYRKQLREFVKEDIKIFTRDGEKEAYRNLDLSAGGNSGDSSGVLHYLLSLEQSGDFGFDYLLFNCGLHDIKRAVPEEHLQVPPERYRVNLQRITALAVKNGAEPVFINTTPADRSRYPEGASFVRYAEDAVAYNRIAESVMEEKGYRVIDLFGFTSGLGLTGDDLFRDHTHFSEQVIREQARFLGTEINRLPEKAEYQEKGTLL